MKSNRAIALASLVIYITVLTFVLFTLSMFVGYFNKNVNSVVIKQNSEEEYSRFLSYISKDVNNKDLVFVKTGENENKDYVIFKFKNGEIHQYVFQNKNLYYFNLSEGDTKKICLCRNVWTNIQNAFTYKNNILKIDFNINKDVFSKSLSINL